MTTMGVGQTWRLSVGFTAGKDFLNQPALTSFNYPMGAIFIVASDAAVLHQYRVSVWWGADGCVVARRAAV